MCRLKGQRECYSTFVFLGTPKSFTKIKSPKYLTQSIHIQAKPKSVFRSKRSALVSDKCKQLDEMDLAKPIHLETCDLSLPSNPETAENSAITGFTVTAKIQKTSKKIQGGSGSQKYGK
ncbi:hypothetical protein ACTXT7_013133 [Hymenolepis weldensis]